MATKNSKRKLIIQFIILLFIWGGLSYQDYPFLENPKISNQNSTSSAPPKKNLNDTDFSKENILGDTHLIELPRLSGKKEDYFVTHRVENGQRVNYSLEYHTPLHHARWVCFSFDKTTLKRKTKRSKSAWGWDPFIPSRFETKKIDYKGFDRGHLVASNDRTYSVEANKQTFYYSNMSPQKGSFNRNAWHQLENIIQDWARTPNFMDKMYVAKGGTLREGEYETILCNKKIAIPKNYWMAVITKKGTNWYGLAFWISHNKTKKQKGSLIPLTCSIDELERRTGLDFFFNLPDNIENQIEKQEPKNYCFYWKGL